MAERLRLINPDAIDRGARRVLRRGDLGAAARARARRGDRRDRQPRREDAPDRDLRARPAAPGVGDGRGGAARSDGGPRRRSIARRASIRSRATCAATCAASTASTAPGPSACGRCTPRSRRSRRTRSPTTTTRSAACARAATTESTTASTAPRRGLGRVRAGGVRHDGRVGRGEAAARDAPANTAHRRGPAATPSKPARDVATRDRRRPIDQLITRGIASPATATSTSRTTWKTVETSIGLTRCSWNPAAVDRLRSLSLP